MMTLLDAIDRLGTLLDKIRAGEGETGADALVATFGPIADTYKETEESGRSQFRSVINLNDSSALLALSGWCATAAINQPAERVLTHALEALCMEDFREDPRENLCALSIVWYAAKRLGTDPKALLERCAVLATPRARAFLEEFVNRPEATRTLRAMGLEASETADGVRFRRRNVKR
jgi:hypothetical protein